MENTQKTYTIGEWLDTWLMDYASPMLRSSTIQNYLYARRRLTKHCPNIENMALEALTPLDFQRMLNALASVYSKSSVAHIKVVYCEAYQDAVRNNICFRNPIREVQIPKHAARKKVSGMTIPEQDAFESVLTQLSFMDHCMILTYLLTGLRRNELRNLRWKDWNSKQDYIQVCESKTATGIRNIPIIPQVTSILHTLAQRKSCEYIFHVNGEKMTDGHIRYICTKVSRIAGIRHVTPHMLRHTFASRLFESGADLKSLAEILGHTDPAFTLKTYVTVSQEHLAEQMRKLIRK